VGGEGVPTSPYLKALPCHKKNPDLGEKQVYFSKDLFMEQEDALTVKPEEEVFWDPNFTNLDYLDGLGQCVHQENRQER
jgi:hypothetical protein